MLTDAILGGVNYTLHRFPLDQKNRSLQAWDAADEYLLEHIANEYASAEHILVLNDAFGALACALPAKQLTCVSDSYISQLATQHNLACNQLEDKAVTLLDSLAAFPTDVSLVVIKQPKNNGFLAAQLEQLSSQLAPGTPVIIAAKAKDIHSSTLKLIAKALHEPTTSLAQKKARLVFATTKPLPHARSVRDHAVSWPLEKTTFSITNHANVFSRDSLDIGARFFINYLPQGKKPLKVIDLGCGNGVIGLSVLAAMPNAKVTFVDESAMAVASAHDNVTTNLAERIADCEFKQNDCLQGFASHSADLVLCNPPFHQAQAITDHIAWQMFVEAKRTLKVGGELRIVGNRHLGYDEKLKRLFNNCRLIGSNNKFVVLSAKKEANPGVSYDF